MSGSRGEVTAPVLDRQAVRRRETRDEIIRAAWELVREEGLAGLAMRDLGNRVGLKAQSLYSYFESKLEIYDGMFHEGYVAFAAEVDALVTSDPSGPVAPGSDFFHASAHVFFDFCTADVVRYQLLFQRTIPGFVPSDSSYAVAREAYEKTARHMAVLGVTDTESVDVWTALLTGLTDQQISNDPGGDRWGKLIDGAVDMFLETHAPHLLEQHKGRNTKGPETKGS